jgi:hypothetical protein
MGFDLDSYEPVASRFNRFIEWAQHAGIKASVISDMMTEPGSEICVFKTSIIIDGIVIATGWAEEVRGAGNVNRTSHVENCETSSLGRCLSNFPLEHFASSDFNKRPSREEMQKVQRMSGSTVITENGDLASDKQRNMIKAVCKSLGKTPPVELQSFTKRQASAYIDELKRMEAGEAPAPQEYPAEEPF